MNKQELIERMEGLKNLFGNKTEYVEIDSVIRLISELDEPETGHADEAPRYVKNILARLRELPLHDREVWLKAIMGEFEQDFSRAKWREGYEQGKLEGEWVGQQLKDADKIRQELNKPVIPEFVVDWIEHCRGLGYSLYQAMELVHENAEIKKWFIFVDNQDLFARAWLDGYKVEEEKRYLVKFKGVYHGDLGYAINFGGYSFYCKERSLSGIRFTHTHKELEEAGFGWVFDCPGIKIEEVDD